MVQGEVPGRRDSKFKVLKQNKADLVVHQKATVAGGLALRPVGHEGAVGKARDLRSQRTEFRS